MKHLRKDGLCVLCETRPALFKYRGKVKRDKHHNVCLQCFRSLDDRNRTRYVYVENKYGTARNTDLGQPKTIDGLR